MSDVGNKEAAEAASGEVAAAGEAPAEQGSPVSTPVTEAPAAPATEPEPVPETGAEEPLAEEFEPDSAPLVHMHFSAPAFLPLELLEDDQTYLVRAADELDDVSALSTDLARLGQLFPIDVRRSEGSADRFQVICGFRRVAALRFLQRDKVLARLHTELSDDDAQLMALAAAIGARAVTAEALSGLKERLESQGRLNPAARDMFEKALSADEELGPEQLEEEVDADELAADVTVRLGVCNQDLSALADVFSELDDEKKDELLKQLRYSSELVSFLEGKR